MDQGGGQGGCPGLEGGQGGCEQKMGGSGGGSGGWLGDVDVEVKFFGENSK